MDFKVIDVAGGAADMKGIPLRSYLTSLPVKHLQQHGPQPAKTPDLRSSLGSSSKSDSGGSSDRFGFMRDTDNGGNGRSSSGQSNEERQQSQKQSRHLSDDDSDGSGRDDVHHRRQRRKESGDPVIGFSEASGPNKEYATFFKSNHTAYDKKFMTVMHQLGYEKAMHGNNPDASGWRLRQRKEAKDMAYPPPTSDKPTRAGAAPGELVWSKPQADAWRDGRAGTSSACLGHGFELTAYTP